MKSQTRKATAVFGEMAGLKSLNDIKKVIRSVPRQRPTVERGFSWGDEMCGCMANMVTDPTGTFIDMEDLVPLLEELFSK